jgi:hypothetical protein
VARRLLVLAAVTGLALALAATALGASVTVRVEGKTRSIFGSVPATVDAENALQALELASILGEFHYQLTSTAFGDYVSQIGKYPGSGNAGWVFKVNGTSPPVGADQVLLRDGDAVLWYWASFGDTGGPPTLELRPADGTCYVATLRDDAGKAVPATAATLHVDGRRVRAGAGGRGCVGKHHGPVRAFAVGAVRSNAVR